MMETTRGRIPDYLRRGDSFASLAEGDNTEISIPADATKPDTSVNSAADLVHLLRSLRFWRVTDITLVEVFTFILREFPLCSEVCLEFASIFPVLTVARTVHLSTPENKLSVAMDGGNIQLITAVMDQGHLPQWVHFKRESNENNPPLLAMLLTRFERPNGNSGSTYYFQHKYGAKTAVIAAGNGDLESMRVLTQQGCALSGDVTVAAARNGHLHCLTYAHEAGFVWGENVPSAAAENGHLACLQYAHENECPWNGAVTVEAARNGHLHCLEYACTNGCPWGTTTIATAINNRQWPCLRYALSNGCVGIWEELLNVVRAGDVESLHVFVQENISVSAFTIAVAAASGQLACVQFLQEVVGCPWDSLLCTSAVDHTAAEAQTASLPCLRYALERGCPGDAEIGIVVCMRGNLVALQYLQGLGYPWDERCASAAAAGGRLRVLEFLHEHGCPWDTSTTIAAALYGHLDCLRYAHMQRCVWDADVTAAACQGSHLDCLKYAHQQGCPWDTFGLHEAARNGNADCLEYALSNGCASDADALQFAAHSGNLPCLRILEDAGFVLSTATIAASMAGAQQAYHIAIDKIDRFDNYARDDTQSRRDASDEKIAAKAALEGHTRCLRYVLWNCHRVDTAAPQFNPAHECLVQCMDTLTGNDGHHTVCPDIVAGGDAERIHSMYMVSRYRLHGRENTRAAAAFGRLEILTFLHWCGCPWDARTCTEAARRGRLDCLRFAHENGCPWDEESPAAAATFGRLHALCCLLVNGCPRDVRTCTAAAGNGHFSCLQFARSHHCPWDESTTTAASASGRLDILTYLKDSGCPWDGRTVIAACEKGHWACAVYAVQQGCPWNYITCRRAVCATKERRVAALQYAAEHEGCEFLVTLCAG